MRLSRIIACACALLATMAGWAQTHYESRVDVGGHAGLTLSRTNFSPSVPQSMIMGFMAGASVRYTEEKHFGLIGEVNIEQRGWKEKYDEGGFSYNRRLTYIQIPVMTHIFFGSKKVRAFFNAGPELGFMIGEKTSANFDYHNLGSVEGYPTTYRQTAQLEMPVKYKLDYGICAGLGMEVQASHRHCLTVEGRFYYGLHDVFANHKSDVFSASNAMSIEITLGYRYRIK